MKRIHDFPNRSIQDLLGEWLITRSKGEAIKH